MDMYGDTNFCYESLRRKCHGQSVRIGCVFQLEEAFQKQQQEEMAARQAEKERLERERIEARKRREVQRITEV